MSIQWIRRGTVLFFILFIIAMTWPGMMLGSRTFPLVFGLPFSMAWIACWVSLSFFVLVLLDWAEGRARSRTEGTGAISTATEAEAETPSTREEL